MKRRRKQMNWNYIMFYRTVVSSSMYRVVAAVILFITMQAYAANVPHKTPASLLRPAVTVEWIDLLPEEDLRLLESAPDIDHEFENQEELEEFGPSTGPKITNNNSAFEDQVTRAVSDANQQPSSGEKSPRTWREALVSTHVRPEFNNKRIRIAGYIVPIEYNDEYVITEFFLAPYFGACINVPPPPPNQIIYVKYSKGFQLEDIYTPFWVEGTIILETQDNDLGLSSYSMRDVKLTEYKEKDDPAFLK